LLRLNEDDEVWERKKHLEVMVCLSYNILDVIHCDIERSPGLGIGQIAAQA
jgi:hypothetical protein